MELLVLDAGNSQPSENIDFTPSVKQSRCRRGPAWRQPGGNRFLTQVSEYLVQIWDQIKVPE